MSEIEQQNFATKPRNRRAVVKGAAWSVPVIAAAIAAPAASASVANAGLAWTDTSTSLLQLRLLDGSGQTITAKVLPTVPTVFTLTNGQGAISGNATVTIHINYPTGLNINLGTARGFGVAAYNGIDTLAGERTVTYKKALGVDYGAPESTYTSVQAFNVPSNGLIQVPVEFGLVGKGGLLNISALSAFAVTLTVDFGAGISYTSTSSISVPVGAGIL